jgi:hypothetical protein
VLELSELGKQKQHDIYLLKFYLEQFRANNLVVILLFLLFLCAYELKETKTRLAQLLMVRFCFVPHLPPPTPTDTRKNSFTDY